MILEVVTFGFVLYFLEILNQIIRFVYSHMFSFLVILPEKTKTQQLNP